MNANSISLDLSTDGLEELADKKPGEKCVLKNVEVTVTKNDGQTLEGDLGEIELGEEGYDDASPENEETEGEMGGKEMGHPIAVIAIGAKPAKSGSPPMAKKAMQGAMA